MEHLEQGFPLFAIVIVVLATMSAFNARLVRSRLHDTRADLSQYVEDSSKYDGLNKAQFDKKIVREQTVQSFILFGITAGVYAVAFLVYGADSISTELIPVEFGVMLLAAVILTIVCMVRLSRNGAVVKRLYRTRPRVMRTSLAI